MKKLLMLNLFGKFLIVLGLSSISQIALGNELIKPHLKLSIPIITQSNTPFWNTVVEGAYQAAKDYDIEVQIETPITLPPDSLEEQIQLFRKVLEQKPPIVVLSAISPAAFRPYLDEAAAQNIPVIGLNTDVYSPTVETLISTDNYGAGEFAAHKMAELIGGEGKIGIISPTPISKNLIDRLDGFITTITQNYKNIEILPIQNTSYELGETTQLARGLITDYPDVKGMFATNQNSSEGIIRAVKELDRVNEIKIIGFNAGKTLVDAVREGVVSGAITQDPRGQGYKAVEAAIGAYQGVALPTIINTDFIWYDSTNIDNPEIQKVLYE